MTTAAQVLAENNFGDTRTGGLAGPMGLFLIVLLGTATVLLIRNMNSRLRRLPDRFPDQRSLSVSDQQPSPVSDPTVPPAPTSAAPGGAGRSVVDPTDRGSSQ
ncbi:hypothetical protein O7606_13990 [Micromonospora sp. WMMD882]|uniref:hypothetical protein n=1 Tax=Micromonospora sp. WMMD882 TaxID=3015151 RepID=UPI00248AB033|nr:hypothetical protein [Micromonospora sp. WMMD882]WBB82397.1 hypothetical protein O7606_13990 [Micromonospora sp. WMMD882]